MQIIDFAQSLLRRWWLLLILGLVGMGAAYAYQLTAPHRYESAVTMQLNPSAASALLPYGTNPGEFRPVATLAASYAEVLRSRSFGEQVVRELGLSLPPDEIARAINARLIPNTNVFRLAVTWSNPQDAQTLAQGIAEVFVSDNLRRQEGQPGTPGRVGGSLREMEEVASTYPPRLEALRRQRDQLDQTVSRGDFTRLSELTSLDQRLTALETSYANLLVEINRARANVDTATIPDHATPGRPVGATSGLQVLLFGLLGGLALAVGIVYVLDTLDDRIRDPQDLAATIDAAPLTVISRIDSRRWDLVLRKSGLVTVVEPRSGKAAEAFRTLRANLSLIGAEHPFRTLLVTSGSPAEGKTVVASNLAVAFAQAGQRVLLVDADLRRPSLHTVFNSPNEHGLTELLAAGIAEPAAKAVAVPTGDELRNGEPEAAAAPGPSDAPTIGEALAETPSIAPSGVDNLWLLTAGRVLDDPSGLLSSGSVPRLLERLNRVWDIVILDSAPVGPVADSLLLASYTDAAIVVCRAGHTGRGPLRTCLQMLAQAARPPLGVVFNDLRPGPLARYGQYGYAYSYAYGRHSYGQEHRNGASKNGHAPAPAPEVKAGS